jgi:hypothetical protein
MMKLIKKFLMGSMLVMASIVAFAAGTSDINPGNFANLQQTINANAGTLFNIVMIVATLAGLILIIKGLVHLKQNYTGTGQEKHMSKGIASLGFGTALILAIPISHILVGSLSPSTMFNTNASTVNFSNLSGT